MGNVTKELDLIRQIEQRDKRIDELELNLIARDAQIGLLCESHRELEASKGYCCCGDCPNILNVERMN